jgi:hypothetical protein
MSYCRAALLPRCFAILPPCCFAALQPCFPITARLPCCLALLCSSAALLHCCSAALLCCFPAPLPCCLPALLPSSAAQLCCPALLPSSAAQLCCPALLPSSATLTWSCFSHPCYYHYLSRLLRSLTHTFFSCQELTQPCDAKLCALRMQDDLSQLFVASPAESEFAASQRSRRESLGTPKSLWGNLGVLLCLIVLRRPI